MAVVERLGGCLAPLYVLGKGGWRIGLASSAVLPRHAACDVMLCMIHARFVRADGRGGMCTRTPVSEGMDDVPMGCEMRG